MVGMALQPVWVKIQADRTTKTAKAALKVC